MDIIQNQVLTHILGATETTSILAMEAETLSILDDDWLVQSKPGRVYVKIKLWAEVNLNIIHLKWVVLMKILYNKNTTSVDS